MAITDEIERLQQAKGDIKDAIEAKGVTVDENATISTYDEYIEQIETAGTYQQKTVTPTAQGITVTPDTGYDALSQVDVNGDANLSAENIAEGVTIFGVTGTLVPGGNLQSKYVVPTAESQTVIADEGYDGLSQVDVYGDENLVAENIAEGVTIFGVEGTYSSGEGYPLERIGTTVTVEAQGAIGKGQPWEGVLNDEYAQEQIGSQTAAGLPTSNYIQMSADGKVAIVDPRSSSIGTSFTIYFFNDSISTFQACSVTMPRNVSNSGTTKVVLNDEGTLICISPPAGSLKYSYSIEIDKEKKTAIAYSSSSSSGDLNGADIFMGRYVHSHFNSNYYISYYDYETHSFKKTSTRNGSTTTTYTNNWGFNGNWRNVRKYGENCYIAIVESYIQKFEFENEFVLSATQYSISNIKPSDFPTPLSSNAWDLSNDLMYICGCHRTYVDDVYIHYLDVGAFNPQDLSFSYIKSIPATFYQSTGSVNMCGLSGGKYIISGSTTANAIIDIATGAVTTQQDILPNVYCWYPRADGWFYNKNNSNITIFAYPKKSNAEYLIYPSHFYTENDKYYGIASSTLNIGDVGEAQLLFGE